MIYLDTFVALAQLLGEDRCPPEAMWAEPLFSTRLIEYEIWTRLRAKKLGRSHADDASALLARVAMIELAPHVLARALEAFPVPVRTLDALHLASLVFLRAQRQDAKLASYDDRLVAAAEALRIPIYDAG